MQFNGPSHYDPAHLKQIGVVVFKAYADADNNGKLNFTLLESFVGSLKKNARDPITKANIFIDDVVNASSRYIRLFSNADQADVERASTFAMSLQPARAMGFYRVDCAKKISYLSSLMKPLTRLLDNASNTNTVPIDIVVDAGVSNIAQMTKMSNDTIDADAHPNVADTRWDFAPDYDTSRWSAILSKLDNFAKN